MENLDDDGYPTDAVLDKITNWSHTDKFVHLMEFVKDIWWAADWGWREYNTKDYNNRDEITYDISTGGWSGNESIINALQDNRLFWMCCWEQSNRGGHYIFKVLTEN
jgi:hypothetical protein